MFALSFTCIHTKYYDSRDCTPIFMTHPLGYDLIDITTSNSYQGKPEGISSRQSVSSLLLFKCKLIQWILAFGEMTGRWELTILQNVTFCSMVPLSLGCSFKQCCLRQSLLMLKKTLLFLATTIKYPSICNCEISI